MEQNGQINPLIVRLKPARSDGKISLLPYSLVAGFRRFNAAKKLKWSDINVQVWKGDDLSAYIMNLGENVTRKNLSPYETAARCIRMIEETGIADNEICRRIPGLSQSYVKQLIRYYRGLHLQLLSAWKAKHPLMTSDIINKIVVLEPERQLTIKIFVVDKRSVSWEDLQELDARDPEYDEDGELIPKPEAKLRKRATMLQMRILADKTRKAPLSATFTLEAKGAALTMLRFCLGEIDSVPWYNKTIGRKWGQVGGDKVLQRMREDIGDASSE
jgi:ParB/RepB/Spo0J family partition protein